MYIRYMMYCAAVLFTRWRREAALSSLCAELAVGKGNCSGICPINSGIHWDSIAKIKVLP